MKVISEQIQANTLIMVIKAALSRLIFTGMILDIFRFASLIMFCMVVFY